MGRRPVCITAARAAVSSVYALARRSNSLSYCPITPLARYVRDSTLRCAGDTRASTRASLVPGGGAARSTAQCERADGRIRAARGRVAWRGVAWRPHSITDVACAWTRTAPRPHTDLYFLHPDPARPTARRLQSGHRVPYPLNWCPCDSRLNRREERMLMRGCGLCQCEAESSSQRHAHTRLRTAAQNAHPPRTPHPRITHQKASSTKHQIG